MISEEHQMCRRRFGAYSAAVLGLLVAGISAAQTVPCPPVLNDSAGNPIAGPGVCNTENEQDWQTRIAGPGVVWYHNFASKAEVDQFREDGDLSYVPDDGNPTTASLGTSQNSVIWNSTDGLSGGGCLEIIRFAGSKDSRNWYRPMSPLSSPGNGRSSDDPAANGAIPLDADGAWGPPARTRSWQAGNYGPASTGSWEGNEFYIQYALKISSSRLTGRVFGGKIQYITRQDRSLTAQELVTSYDYDPEEWRIYKGGTGEISGDIGNPLHIFDEWVTYLVHVVPGDEVEGADPDEGGSNTRVNVYRHRANEQGYTHIFERNDLAIDYQNAYLKAWNAIIFSGYFNDFNFPEDFYQRYDEVIFSRQFIPPPAR